MIWLFIWILAVCWLIAFLVQDRFTDLGEGIMVTIFGGGFLGGMVLFLLPHVIAGTVWGDNPVYQETVELQEVNDHYVVKNAEGYAIVYGDEHNFTAVQLDSTPPEPKEGCKDATAKVYEMQNTNKYWSILPMYFSKQYIICVPEGGINK